MSAISNNLVFNSFLSFRRESKLLYFSVLRFLRNDNFVKDLKL